MKQDENLLKIWPKLVRADKKWEKDYGYTGGTSLVDGLARLLQTDPNLVMLSSRARLEEKLRGHISGNPWCKALWVVVRQK